MKCVNCGVEFKPQNSKQKYCTIQCRRNHDYDLLNPVINKTCVVCGKQYQTRIKSSVCCSEMCRQKRKRKTPAGKDREFTDSTVYLCQKWRREGTSVRTIMDMLDRSEANVRKALRVKLTDSAYRMMEQYAR